MFNYKKMFLKKQGENMEKGILDNSAMWIILHRVPTRPMRWGF